MMPSGGGPAKAHEMDLRVADQVLDQRRSRAGDEKGRVHLPSAQGPGGLRAPQFHLGNALRHQAVVRQQGAGQGQGAAPRFAHGQPGAGQVGQTLRQPFGAAEQPGGLEIEAAQGQQRGAGGRFGATLHESGIHRAGGQQRQVFQGTAGVAQREFDTFAAQILAVAVREFVIGPGRGTGGQGQMPGRRRVHELVGQEEGQQSQKGRRAVDLQQVTNVLDP
jgi:hypothetical protein